MKGVLYMSAEAINTNSKSGDVSFIQSNNLTPGVFHDAHDLQITSNNNLARLFNNGFDKLARDVMNANGETAGRNIWIVT